VLIASSVIARESMAVVERDKKKLTYNELEEHTVDWAIERLSEFRDDVSDIEDDDDIPAEKKDFLYRTYVTPIDNLIYLLNPLRHDARYLLEWAFNFIDTYGDRKKKKFTKVEEE
jgi:hypothetical protein